MSEQATTGQPLDLDETSARDAAATLRNVAASAFHVPATHLTEALNALEAGAMALDERAGLVAEARAAREVMRAADSYRAFLPLEVVQALDAHDETTRGNVR